MPWNEPGGSGNKDPWGNRGNGEGPPDLDEVVRKFQQKFGGLFGGKRGGGGTGQLASGFSGMFLVIVLVIAAWLVYDSTYVIDQAERGVVLRFGGYVDTLQPGLSIRFPRPIENIYRVNVEEVRTVGVGGTKAESLMLTQDENIIDIKFTVQYQVKSARDYLFNVREPDTTLRDVTESAVREVVGKSNMDYVITGGRDVIAASTKVLVQEILDTYGTGLLVISLNMQDAQAPDEVQDAFADAVKAREDEVRFKNEAEAYAKDVQGRASGAEQRKIREAQGYREKVIESATGEAARFLQLLAEYEKAPEVTRERLYLDTIEQVLANSSKVMTDTKGSNNLLYLPLDRILQPRQPGNMTGQSEQEYTPQATPQPTPRGGIRDSRGLLRKRGGR